MGVSAYISMIKTLTMCVLAIASHVSASITVALFSVNEWSCDDYWYIFGFCR